MAVHVHASSNCAFTHMPNVSRTYLIVFVRLSICWINNQSNICPWTLDILGVHASSVCSYLGSQILLLLPLQQFMLLQLLMSYGLQMNDVILLDIRPLPLKILDPYPKWKIKSCDLKNIHLQRLQICVSHTQVILDQQKYVTSVTFNLSLKCHLLAYPLLSDDVINLRPVTEVLVSLKIVDKQMDTVALEQKVKRK